MRTEIKIVNTASKTVNSSNQSHESICATSVVYGLEQASEELWNILALVNQIVRQWQSPDVMPAGRILSEGS